MNTGATGSGVGQEGGEWGRWNKRLTFFQLESNSSESSFFSWFRAECQPCLSVCLTDISTYLCRWHLRSLSTWRLVETAVEVLDSFVQTCCSTAPSFGTFILIRYEYALGFVILFWLSWCDFLATYVRVCKQAHCTERAPMLVLLVNRGTMPSLGAIKGVLDTFLSRSPMLWYYRAKSHPHLC